MWPPQLIHSCGRTAGVGPGSGALQNRRADELQLALEALASVGSLRLSLYLPSRCSHKCTLPSMCV
jgi:hypothetical protein